MGSGIKQSNLKTNYRLIGVFSSAAAFLTDLNKTSAKEGMVYYDTTLNQLRNYDGSSWSPAGQNGNTAGSLDDASQIGAKITNTDQIEIERSYSSGAVFVLDQNNTGASARCINLENASNDASSITQNFASTNGYDVSGTSATWTVSYVGLGVFDGGLTITADSTAFTIGDGSDMTMQFVDATPGSVGSGLLIAGASAHEQVQFGDSSYRVDVWFEGTSDTNYMLWDASANELILEAVDLGLQNSDFINFGNSNNFTMTCDGTDFLWDGAAADTVIKIGATNNQNLIIYGGTATNLITFDTDNSALLCIFDGFDLQMKDADKILFGGKTDGDLIMQWDATNFLIEAGTQDTGQIRIGSTNAIDLVIYDNAASGTVTFDVSTSTVDINGWDTRHQDDDYLLLGNSATAGSNTDATMRWDASNSELEIIGATRFEDNVSMDGNLTLLGTLIMSGALAPGSIALGDTEILSFGDGTDYKISTAGSTAALIIAAQVADDAVQIGDGSIATDFIIQNTTTGGADIWWDDSAETFYFGTDDDGVDVQFYGDTSGADMLWDEGADQLVLIGGSSISLNDDVELLLGTGSSNAGVWSIYSDGTTLFVAEVSSAGKGVELGVDGKGVDVKFFGEAGSSFMEWTQDGNTNGALIFDAADAWFGDGDLILLGDGKDLSFSASGSTVTATLASGSAWNISDTDHSSSKVTFGVTGGGNGLDIQFNSKTSGDDMIFDASDKTFTLTDVSLVHSYDDDTVVYTTVVDATDFLTLTATDSASAKYTIGSSSGTHSIDFVLQSGTGGDNIIFDGQGKTLTFTDCSAVFDYDDGTISYTVSVDSSDFLNINGDDGGQLILGANGTDGMDIYINTITSGEDIIFDAGAKTLTFDNVDIILGDGDLIKFGDAGVDGSIVSDGTNIDVTINASMTLGDGGTSNYTSIAADGEITLTGTAKVTKNHQLPISTGGGSSTVSILTGAPTIDFNASDETAYASFQTPNDWDGASDMSVVMMVKNQIAETSGDDVSFTLTVKGISDGEAHTEVGQTVAILQDLTGGDEGQNYINKCTGTIVWDDGSHAIAAGDSVFIKVVANLGSGDECTGPLHITDWWIEYTADSLGTAT